MTPTLTIAAIIIALPGSINALVSLYDRFFAKTGRTPVALTVGTSGLWTIRVFNGVGLALLAAVIAQTWLDRPTEAPSPSSALHQVGTSPLSSPTQPPHEPGRIYTDKTAEELLKSCDTRTQMQCDLIITDQKGKWIVAHGKIGGIAPGGTVVITVAGDMRYVACSFADKWKQRLGIFTRGEPVSVVGQINGIPILGALSLDACELL